MNYDHIPYMAADIVAACYEAYSVQTAWLDKRGLTWDVVRAMGREEQSKLQAAYAGEVQS